MKRYISLGKRKRLNLKQFSLFVLSLFGIASWVMLLSIGIMWIANYSSMINEAITHI